MGSPEKTFPATQFGGKWECGLTRGLRGELGGVDGRARHGGAAGELWWTAVQRRARSSSPERARQWRLYCHRVSARERRKEENERVQELEDDAMEVMRALNTDERGVERRTDAKWRTDAPAGRPRRR